LLMALHDSSLAAPFRRRAGSRAGQIDLGLHASVPPKFVPQ
jgi:hypothetical protein